jgi:hypothetical protein
MNNQRYVFTAIVTLALLATSTYSTAKEFSYDYAQVGIGTGTYKSYDDEYYILASKPINNNISVKGTLSYFYGDWNDPGEYEEQRVNGYSLEGVYHKNLTSTTDILASAKVAHTDFKLVCTPTTGVCGTYSDATPSFNHYIAAIGARHNIKDGVEIEGRYSFIRTKWTSSTSTARQASLSLMKEVFDKTSIGVEYAWGLTGTRIDHYGLLIRKNF